ncbi:hypothetical protein BD410DRAFT_739877 [Rickenella mellea]|uniref:Uncharacterized protein n=1 Tax=Rickenella mellea TaxID=50990 RepID=A0A4Y7QLL8_9AGAM|nr:hypothetical protein BD410DRAFT_739877 [Rickenella mellea]
MPKDPPQDSPSHSPSPNSNLRQSRIRFPADSDIRRSTPSPVQERDVHANAQAGPTSNPSLSSILKRNEAIKEQLGERRRVRSVDMHDSNVAYHVRGHPVAGPSQLGPSRRRAVSHIVTGSIDQEDASDEGVADMSFSSIVGLEGPNANGNQDAQDQTDPNILADVQRALKYKSRVEARLKAAKSNPKINESLSSAFPSPVSSLSGKSLPPTQPQPSFGRVASAVYEGVGNGEVVDFSPSVGAAPLHPVPSSSNDGTTLDWSGDSPDDDRRDRKWSISLSRTKHKEKAQLSTRKGVLEKQDSMYSDKILRIKAKASPQTLRKAEITSNQLQRRYDTLYPSLGATQGPMNLAAVARWFSNQDDVFKRLIDDAEPLSWLRHLRHRPGAKAQGRLPWHLSALISEEYSRSHRDEEIMSTIPEDFSATDLNTTSEFGVLTTSPMPMRSPTSRPTSFRSIDAIIPKRRRSDDLISFEPHTQSRRNSLGNDSHKGLEKPLRAWRTSLQGKPDSPRSSLHALPERADSPLSSLVSLTNAPPPRQQDTASPTSSRHNLKDVVKRIGRRRQEQSDDGSSSAMDSLSEEPRAGVNPRKARKRRRSSRLRGDDGLSADSGSDIEQHVPSPPDSSNKRHAIYHDVETPRPTKNFPLPLLPERGINNEAMPQTSKLKPFASRTKLTRRRLHESLPGSPQSSVNGLRIYNRAVQVDERARNDEYERKKETLTSLKIQNARTRSVLQTASRTVQEYDELQRGFSQALGLSYSRILPEVLEALSHDPSAVTGNTRRLTGWRAVEDIHERRSRQRVVLQAFLASLPIPVVTTAEVRGVCDAHISTVLELVEQLSGERQQVLDCVQEAGSLLSRVKELRDQLKPEFDAAERETSASYPELVRLESLLDRLINRRNRLWKLGETSLSLVLSSSAPFMKTFGRPIWDDLHDFLVIPWYRNEFSGEDEWYPVKFPERGALHWLRILLVFFTLPTVLWSSTRVLFYIFVGRRMWWMPDFVPLLIRYFINWVMVSSLSFTFLLLSLSFSAECFVLLWWTAWVFRLVK